MKLKYYMRGVGVGIVFCAIVLFAAFQHIQTNNMSDEDIKKRAMELGLVEQKKVDLSTLSNDTEKQDNQQTSEDVSASSEKEDTSANVTEENTTEATTEATTEQIRVTTITLTVNTGMDSRSVANLLQEQGAIENAQDFDQYLENNGYSSKIAVGEYQVTVGDDYQTIAQKITGR